MSAGRSASGLLFALVATVILFGVFAGISSLNVLEKHAYMPEFGWQQPKVSTPAGIVGGVCAPLGVRAGFSGPSVGTTGFPLSNTRQADAPHDCLKATNPLARSMNFAIYFAAAAIISVAAFERIRHRL